jgi:hypothetical protein
MPLRNTLVALALLAASPAVPAQAAAGWEVAPLPAQGLYEGCSPGTEIEACIGRLATIRAAGFHCVLNYSAWYGSPAEVLEYADAASALGLQLIWPLNHPAWRGLTGLVVTYPTLLTGRSEPLNSIATAIRLVAQHPATWGFYIGDELPRAEADRVAALSVTVRELAPRKPQLYIARPGAARLRPFARIADVAGADVYPIGSGDPPVARVARTAEAVTTEAKTHTAVVLQAFSWSQYRPGRPPLFPSEQRLRKMRDAAIRQAQPSLILWYSYQDILRSDDPQRHWRDLAHAAFAR